MTAPPPDLPADAQKLIDEKKFPALEALWTEKVEAKSEPLEVFFGIAAAVKKKGGGPSALSWLRLLADEREGDERIRVLLEAVRMFPTDAEVRKTLTAALRARFGSHPVFPAVLAKFPVEGAADPSEVAGKIARWLQFLPGEIYYMPGRGAGRLVEMNPALDVMRVEVGGARLPLSLVSAEKNLTRLPPEHFLRKKVEDSAALAALVEKDAPEAVRWLLASFGRPLTVAQIKEHLAGIVPEERWSAFWTAARKHPQLLVSGSAKSAVVSWTESADAAEESVRGELREGSAGREDGSRPQAREALQGAGAIHGSRSRGRGAQGRRLEPGPRVGAFAGRGEAVAGRTRGLSGRAAARLA